MEIFLVYRRHEIKLDNNDDTKKKNNTLTEKTNATFR